MSDTSNTLDKALDLTSTLMTQIGKAFDSYGPIAKDLAIEASRIMAIQHIMMGIVFLLISFVCLKVAMVYFPRAHMYDNQGKEDGFIICSVVACTSSVAGAIVFGTAFFKLTYAAAWFGMFKPELYIAYQIIEKVLSK